VWIERMCGKFKSLAPNHLFGIGYEGFYGEASLTRYVSFTLRAW